MGDEPKRRSLSRWARGAPEPRVSAGVPSYKDDPSRGRYPYSLVWTQLPLISWLLPPIGHLGITDSRGVAYDFAGPYTIGVDDLAFGSALRVLRLDPSLARGGPEGWDAGLDAGCDVYTQRMHNIVTDNCHSHVAACLNNMNYGGSTGWSMVALGARVFFTARYTSAGAVVAVWLPAAICWGLIIWGLTRI